ACVALLFLHRERIRPGRLLIILLVCVAAGAAASYALRPEFTENYWTRLAGSVQGFFTETAGLLSGRAESWTRLAAFLAQHPWQLLFGIGYKTLPYTNLLGRPVVADNMYLSLLVETG